MFNVGNNLLSPPLSGLIPGALPGSASPVGGGLGPAGAADGISQFQPPAGDGAASAASWFGAGNGAGGFMAQFMSTIFAALTQMAQYFTSMFGTPPWPQGQFGPAPQPTPVPGGPAPQPGPQQPGSSGGGGNRVGGGEQFYSSAELSSKGDPHDSFEGTTNDGQTVGGKWNNMHDHPNLLLSNSFVGGFRISTDTTDPNNRGITRNQSASIDSDYGRNVVTMNGDGSYSVLRDGNAVELSVGKAQDLGHGESVTLNADGSLTVADQNKSGGEITTTLSTKNGGVGIEAQAQNVELGGYLERQGRKLDSPDGGAQNAAGAQPAAAPQASAAQGLPATGLPFIGGLPTQPSTQYAPYQPYEPYQPYGGGQTPTTDMPPIDQLLGA